MDRASRASELSISRLSAELDKFSREYQEIQQLQVKLIEQELAKFAEEYSRLPSEPQQIQEPPEQDNTIEQELAKFAEEYSRLPSEPRKPRTFLNILGQQSDELTYSKILAYFLDPKERHGLDTLFLESFLNAIGKEELLDNLHEVTVDTEYHTGTRRADILIASESLVICIENKIYAGEGGEQTNDLYREICADTEFKKKEKIFVFLTPDGRKPSAPNFIPLSYEKLFQCIEKRLGIISRDIPFATLGHLTDFLQTIKEEFMEEKKKVFSEKSKLYIKYCEQIEAVWEAFKKDIKDVGEHIKERLKQNKLIDDTWEINPTQSYVQIYKKKWNVKQPWVHFEFYIYPEWGLTEGVVPFMVDVEGKGRDKFFDEFEKAGFDKKSEDEIKEVVYKYPDPDGCKDSLLYKEYPLEGDPNNLPDVVVKAFREFKFVEELIDKTLDKLKKKK